jgi:hypothetical protein
MRRTGKQGLHERVKQGEALKLQRIRARRTADLSAQISEDLSGNSIDNLEDLCQATSNPPNGEKPCK